MTEPKASPLFHIPALPARVIWMQAKSILLSFAALTLLFHGVESQALSAGWQSHNSNVAAAGHTRTDDDAAREAWRIQVEPYAVLGSGRPGVMAADINKPDGVEFAPSGLLLITDAGNRRIQVWDVKRATRVGEFGRKYFGGEITNIAVAPDGTVYVSDSELNVLYAFAPAESSNSTAPKASTPSLNYKFLGTRFGEQGFRKLGGIAIDSRGRIYIADGTLWEVRRYTPDCKADPTWRFERTLAGGDTVLHRCEGMVIDEQRGLLYVASEADAVIKVFDLETGAFKRRLIGAKPDREGRPTGVHVFSGSVEGLTIARGYLLAADEEIGCIQIFDLSLPDFFDTDMAGYGTSRKNGASAYKGFFGRTARVNFDTDDTPNPDLEMKRRVEEGSVIPGIVNPPGYLCSPDEVAAYTDATDGETYVAIADQCNYRVLIYRWSDIQKALAASNQPSPR